MLGGRRELLQTFLAKVASRVSFRSVCHVGAILCAKGFHNPEVSKRDKLCQSESASSTSQGGSEQVRAMWVESFRAAAFSQTSPDREWTVGVRKCSTLARSMCREVTDAS